MTVNPTPLNNEKLRAEIEDLVPCIDPYCDKHGTTMEGSADEPEPAQCQFCYVERFPVIEKLLALFHQALEAREVEGRIDELQQRVARLERFIKSGRIGTGDLGGFQAGVNASIRTDVERIKELEAALQQSSKDGASSSGDGT